MQHFRGFTSQQKVEEIYEQELTLKNKYLLKQQNIPDYHFLQDFTLYGNE